MPCSEKCGAFGNILGRFGAGRYIEKSFGPLPPHSSLRIEMTLYFIGAERAGVKRRRLWVGGRCWPRVHSDNMTPSMTLAWHTRFPFLFLSDSWDANEKIFIDVDGK